MHGGAVGASQPDRPFARRALLPSPRGAALWFSDGEGPPGADGGGQAEGGREIELAEGRWLLNPGSVGQPRDGDPRAAWLELDTDAWKATYHRTTYDIDAAAEAIREAGLPELLADRLYIGQ